MLRRVTCCLSGVLLLVSTAIVSAADPADGAKSSFRGVLIEKHRELLRDAAKFINKHPQASDLDEAFAWAFEASRRFSLEAEGLPLAEKFLQTTRGTASLQPIAKQVLCLGLAKTGKLNEAVAAFQDSLQFVRFNSANESLDLAVELVGQAGLAGEHAKAKHIYETLANRLSLSPQVGEFCENRLRKLELVGQPAADLELTDLGGQAASVAAVRGKVLLIDFWATNCPPCLAEFPKLKQLYTDYHDKDFEVLGLSLDESRDIVDAFQSRAQLPWRLVVDAEQVKQAREKYRVRTIPSLFLVDQTGRIAQVDLKGQDLRQAVEKLLGNQPAVSRK